MLQNVGNSSNAVVPWGGGAGLPGAAAEAGKGFAPEAEAGPYVNKTTNWKLRWRSNF